MKIAVLCLPGIGDSLMATPMIRLLRAKYPKARIDLICMFGGVAYCFKNNSNITTIYTLSLYNAPLISGIFEILKLRKNKYDISVLAFPSYRREYHIVQFLLGAKRRISHVFTKGFWHEWNFLDTERVAVDEKVHNVVNNLNLLMPLGINWRNEKVHLMYDLILNDEDDKFGRNFLKELKWIGKNVVGIHPGSINSPAGVYKRWSLKNFAALVKELIKNKKRVLIFVGPFEIDLGKKISDLVDDTRNCKIVTHTSFGQSLGILKHIDALISNDNGFAHLANGLQVPEIVLFGPTNPLWCCPIDTRFTTIIRKATFIPWFRNDMKVTHPPAGIHSGMNSISVDDVLTAIQRKK